MVKLTKKKREKLRSDHGRGFSRSAKEWERSIADHIGMAIDNGHALDYLLNIGLAFMGYNQFGIPGILMGPLALKLAEAPNIPASTAGVAVLGYMGLTELGILNHLYEGAGDLFTAGGMVEKGDVPIIGKAREGLRPPWWWPIKRQEEYFPPPMEYTTPTPIMDRKKR